MRNQKFILHTTETNLLSTPPYLRQKLPLLNQEQIYSNSIMHLYFTTSLFLNDAFEIPLNRYKLVVII